MLLYIRSGARHRDTVRRLESLGLCASEGVGGAEDGTPVFLKAVSFPTTHLGQKGVYIRIILTWRKHGVIGGYNTIEEVLNAVQGYREEEGSDKEQYEEGEGVGGDG